MPENSASQSPADKLIVALDAADSQSALATLTSLKGEARIFKIGLELLYADGLVLTRALSDAGFQLFLDAKLLDIPNTVERAVANISKLGASFLTVHGTDAKTLGAAIRGRRDDRMKLLAVTVLTSLEQADLADQGLAMALPELVVKRAKLAKDAGFDGVIASPAEIRPLRDALGPDFLIVTPGIRPRGADAGDQSRTATPGEAIAAGADYLVVGRPITAASDPNAAARAILSEIEAGSRP